MGIRRLTEKKAPSGASGDGESHKTRNITLITACIVLLSTTVGFGRDIVAKAPEKPKTTSLEAAVESICDEVADARAATTAAAIQARDDFESASSVTQARDAVLSATNARIAELRGIASLAASLKVPKEKRPTHEDLEAALARNLARVRAYRESLDMVPSASALATRISSLPRAAIEDDEKIIEANLRRLGGDRCHLRSAGAPVLFRWAPPVAAKARRELSADDAASVATGDADSGTGLSPTPPASRKRDTGGQRRGSYGSVEDTSVQDFPEDAPNSPSPALDQDEEMAQGRDAQQAPNVDGPRTVEEHDDRSLPPLPVPPSGCTDAHGPDSCPSGDAAPPPVVEPETVDPQKTSTVPTDNTTTAPPDSTTTSSPDTAPEGP